MDAQRAAEDELLLGVLEAEESPEEDDGAGSGGWRSESGYRPRGWMIAMGRRRNPLRQRGVLRSNMLNVRYYKQMRTKYFGQSVRPVSGRAQW